MERSFTDKQLQDWKEKLLRRKEEIRHEIMDDLKRDAGEEYQELVQAVRDQGDTAMAELKESTVFSLIELKYRELEAVEQALARMEAGTYGRCIDCGGWIGSARLEAALVAVRCRKCQEELEKREKM